MAQANQNFSARPAFRLQLDVNQTSQSIDGNYSMVNIQLRIVKQQASPSYSFNNSTWSVSVAGNSWSGNFTFDFRNSDSLLLFATDLRVGHNADGSMQIGAASSVNAQVLGTAGPGLTLTLSTIPRATQPSLRYPTINAGDTQVVNLPRASSGFTHAIQLFYGNTATTVVENGATDSASFVVSMEMLRQTPNNTIGNGFVRAITYSGSTQIGYKDTPINIQAGPTVIPTFSTITAVEATAGVAANIGALVKTISTLKATITGAAGTYGSTITGYQIRFSNGQATINAASGTTSPLTSSGTLTVTARVTDSRGRYTEKSINLTILNYGPPAITTATIQRALSSGVVNENGTFGKLTLALAASSLVVGGTQKNALALQIFYRLRGSSTWSSQTKANIGGVSYSNSALLEPTFDIEKAYEIRVDVMDDFMTSSVILTMATANIFMHWDAKVGVGVGKFRENGMLDVLGEIYHRDGGLVQPSGMIVAYAGTTAPKGWLICNGSSVSRSTYASLYLVIGTLYGNVDDNTFNLPNLKGRVPVGVDPGQTEFDGVGETGGAKTVALSVAQMPSHTHAYTTFENYGVFTQGGGTGMDKPQKIANNANTTSAGSGAAHQNLQPYMALHYIIKI